MALDFTGKYQLVSSDKFDEYMKAVGVGFVMRKMASTAKPVCEIKKTGDNAYSMKTSTTFKTTEISFKLGVPFEETTADGRKCQSTITMESDNKMKHVQVCADQTLAIWREFTPTEMKMTMDIPGQNAVCTRIYNKIA